MKRKLSKNMEAIINIIEILCISDHTNVIDMLVNHQYLIMCELLCKNLDYCMNYLLISSNYSKLSVKV